VTAARIAHHEVAHAVLDRGRERLSRQRVDAGDGGDVVGHELVEAHVDRTGGREQVAIADAGGDHGLHARRPVPSDGDRVRAVDDEAGRVGDHRRHRAGDRHRVAVGDHERRVGKHPRQDAELLQMLGRLEHPPRPTPQPREDLEHRPQILVRRGLVVREIPVAPRRDGRGGLEEHGREVDREELDLLVDVVDRHLVHALEVGQRELEERDRLLGPHDPRIGLAGRGPLGVRQHRLQRLPVRQRAQRRVGSHQVVQVRGPGSRQAADHDRPLDGDPADLRMTGEQRRDE
jgi:hypothetical protein